MVCIDTELLSATRQMITGANIHRINTLIAMYQHAVVLHNQGHPDYQPYPEQFERELRVFVSSRRRSRSNGAKGLRFHLPGNES
jgi:hypothetical protein